jgi:hypothetical protein
MYHKFFKTYKGFTINSVRDIDVFKPKKLQPIEYYEVLDADPDCDGKRWFAEDTVKKCENVIDEFLEKLSVMYGHPVKKANDIKWK